MDSASEEIYLQKIEEYVYDEGKLVTCSWLSEKLQVSLNATRLLLETFLKDNLQAKSCHVSTIYVLLGVKHDQQLAVVLSKQCELEEKRKQFSNVSSELLYAIQKADDIEWNLLNIVDPISINNHREKPLLGSIVGKNCVKRKVRVKQLVVVPTTSEGIKTEVKIENKDEAKKDLRDSNIETINKTKGKQKQGGIANFFATSSAKTTNNSSTVKPKVIKKQNNIMSNFLKTSEKQTKTENEIDTVSNINNEALNEIQNVGVEEVLIESTDEHVKNDENARDKESPLKQSKVTKPKTVTKRKSENSRQSQKKRRRVIEVNDSDSDDIFGDEEDITVNSLEHHSDDDVMDHEPISKPEIQTFLPRNKKRKEVTKSFMDKDGYMITKKEYEYVTASEDEEEDKEQKPLNSNNTIQKSKCVNKKEVSPPAPVKSIKRKGKRIVPAANQKLLMSFFQKV